jgi:hypothetical protein
VPYETLFTLLSYFVGVGGLCGIYWGGSACIYSTLARSEGEYLLGECVRL